MTAKTSWRQCRRFHTAISTRTPTGAPSASAVNGRVRYIQARAPTTTTSRYRLLSSLHRKNAHTDRSQSAALVVCEKYEALQNRLGPDVDQSAHVRRATIGSPIRRRMAKT